jgi:hypothetical protein
MWTKQMRREKREKRKVRWASWSRLTFALCYLLFALLYCSFELQAQAETRSVHRLAWVGGEFVLRYEVVIPREEVGGFRELHREFTEQSFIEVSLLPGRYRFEVIPYDYLNQAAPTSNWAGFEVRQALRPELDVALPVYFYVNENAVHTLNISGRNLDPDAEIVLRRPGVSIVPNSKLSRDNNLYLSFNNDRLIPGEYEVYVRNPGGFETRGGTVIVIYLLPAPLYLLPVGGYRIGIDELKTQAYIAFSWWAVQGANAYIFTLYEQTVNGLRQIVQRPPENRTSWTLENVSTLGRGTFIWQVEAVNRGASGAIEQRGRIGEGLFIIDIPRPGRIQMEYPGILYGY